MQPSRTVAAVPERPSPEIWGPCDAAGPVPALVQAAAAIPKGARASAGSSLQRMLADVASERSRPHFGMCANCLHLRIEHGSLEKASPYVRALVDDALAQAELEQLCVNFRPGAGSVMKGTVGKVYSP